MGSYLQVTETGAKSWLLRYEHNGRERWMGLGSVKDFSLREARERARAKRQLLADGVDPIDAKISAKDLSAKEARERQTFKQAADEFLKLHAPGWRNDKHRAQWRATLDRICVPQAGHALSGEHRRRDDQRRRRPDLDPALRRRHDGCVRVSSASCSGSRTASRCRALARTASAVTRRCRGKSCLNS